MIFLDRFKYRSFIFGEIKKILVYEEKMLVLFITPKFLKYHVIMHISEVYFVLKGDFAVKSKNMFMKLSGTIATFALVITTLIANSACTYIMYQDELPEGAKKLRRF